MILELYAAFTEKGICYLLSNGIKDIGDHYLTVEVVNSVNYIFISHIIFY